MKKERIEICDSRRRKGEYFVRLVGANGKKISTSETLKSVAAVHTNMLVQFKIFTGLRMVDPTRLMIDRTKDGKFSKRYRIEHFQPKKGK